MAANKFHLSEKGPARCTAQEGNCPLGGEHFDSQKDAEKAFEKTMESQSVSTFSSEKNLENKFSKTTDLDDEVEQHENSIKSNEYKLENLENAEEKLKSAMENENKDLSEFMSEANKNGVVYGQARGALASLDRANRNYGSMNPSFPSPQYKTLKDIENEISGQKKTASSEIKDSSKKLAQAEAERSELKAYLKDKTGYSENPKFGTPSGKSTLSEWKGKQPGNYSSAPTKDVPVLENSEKFCTKCGDGVEYDNKKYRSFHVSNNDYKCNPEKLPPNSKESYLSGNAVCRFCGTGDPSRTEFKQMSYSDETHCKRCGGVNGYGIGD